jgi:hypothetical protein
VVVAAIYIRMNNRLWVVDVSLDSTVIVVDEWSSHSHNPGGAYGSDDVQVGIGNDLVLPLSPQSVSPPDRDDLSSWRQSSASSGPVCFHVTCVSHNR